MKKIKLYIPVADTDNLLFKFFRLDHGFKWAAIFLYLQIFLTKSSTEEISVHACAGGLRDGRYLLRPPSSPDSVLLLVSSSSPLVKGEGKLTQFIKYCQRMNTPLLLVHILKKGQSFKDAHNDFKKQYADQKQLKVACLLKILKPLEARYIILDGPEFQFGTEKRLLLERDDRDPFFERENTPKQARYADLGDFITYVQEKARYLSNLVALGRLACVNRALYSLVAQEKLPGLSLSTTLKEEVSSTSFSKLGYSEASYLFTFLIRKPVSEATKRLEKQPRETVAAK